MKYICAFIVGSWQLAKCNVQLSCASPGRKSLKGHLTCLALCCCQACFATNAHVYAHKCLVYATEGNQQNGHLSIIHVQAALQQQQQGQHGLTKHFLAACFELVQGHVSLLCTDVERREEADGLAGA